MKKLILTVFCAVLIGKDIYFTGNVANNCEQAACYTVEDGDSCNNDLDEDLYHY